jgi:predicted P-loop ATPase
MDRTTPTWSDLDDAGLREFMETKYNFTDRQKIYDAVALSAQDNRKHPIREYLKRLQWDGVPRAETLLIDFLNAQDSPYTRAVTRKALLGATARVMNPGVKHDHVLVLVGPQGCRKSTTIAKLGGNWYTDSLYTMNGKEASELIQGYWLVELSEMAATRKSDVEMIKQFLTKTSDNFRAAYDRRAMEHPRQCAFFGTTNDDEFLVDATGNRRFWPVAVSKVSELKYAELDQYYVDQIWAEMLVVYNLGEEKLYLSAEEEATAQDIQAEYTRVAPTAGSIVEWLNSFVPEDWNSWDAQKRQEFYNCPDMFEAFSIRDRVCAAEVWVECLKGNAKELTLAKATEIRNVINKIPGWVKTGSLRYGGGYGVQKGFKRG